MTKSRRAASERHTFATGLVILLFGLGISFGASGAAAAGEQMIPGLSENKILFGILSGLVLAAAAWGIRYASVKRLRRQYKILEQEHAFQKERTRMAQDIHDDLGARLTQISLLTELARRGKTPEEVEQHLVKIENTTREMVQAMDGIVWAVDPTKDSLEKVAEYLSAFAQEIVGLGGMSCRLEIPAVLPEAPISAEGRHNICLVAKEALNNAVKYSRATEVELRLEADARQIKIQIKDNGVGMDRSKEKNSRNGLRNMRSRIEKLGGVFEFQSEPGRGTRVIFSIPVDNLKLPGMAGRDN